MGVKYILIETDEILLSQSGSESHLQLHKLQLRLLNSNYSLRIHIQYILQLLENKQCFSEFSLN